MKYFLYESIVKKVAVVLVIVVLCVTIVLTSSDSKSAKNTDPKNGLVYVTDDHSISKRCDGRNLLYIYDKKLTVVTDAAECR